MKFFRDYFLKGVIQKVLNFFSIMFENAATKINEHYRSILKIRLLSFPLFTFLYRSTFMFNRIFLSTIDLKEFDLIFNYFKNIKKNLIIFPETKKKMYFRLIYI